MYATALLFSLAKSYTLAGFEPGASVRQADAMTSDPRR
jgi:hypothetical protein